MAINPDKPTIRELLTGRGNPDSRRGWFYTLFIITSLMLSILPRLPFMHHFSSNWRSSQTLLTSFWFQKEGISLFHSQLPLFGPPWEVPFEFPLYQAMSTVFSNISHLNLTVSSRVASLAFFYISAVFLLLLCLEFLDNKFLSSIIFLVYLWLPYDILYSTEILIDYLSVALALGYIFWIKKYMDSPGNILLFFLAILFGCLGAAVKITTMAITILPAILISLDGLQSWGFQMDDIDTPGVLPAKIRKHKLPLSLLTAMALLPVLSAGLWTKFADHIKKGNTFTTWLTSSNLTFWNFGTIAQKTSFTNWWNWLMKIDSYFFLGGILLIFLLLGIIYLYRMPLKSRCFYGAAFGGVLLTIFIFFNLYLHEYYYIAVSAYVSILIGFGIYCLVKFLLPNRWWWIGFSAIFFLFVVMNGVEQYKGFQADIQAEIAYVNPKLALAGKVDALTPEDKYIIAFQSDWYPDFMFYAQRKGLVITPRPFSVYSCGIINKYAYRTIVVVDTPPNPADLLKLLNCFKTVKSIEPDIYLVQ